MGILDTLAKQLDVQFIGTFPQLLPERCPGHFRLKVHGAMGRSEMAPKAMESTCCRHHNEALQRGLTQLSGTELTSAASFICMCSPWHIFQPPALSPLHPHQSYTNMTLSLPFPAKMQLVSQINEKITSVEGTLIFTYNVHMSVSFLRRSVSQVFPCLWHLGQA